MASTLEGFRVAALVEEGFEQVELVGPVVALEQAGAQIDLISPREGKVRGWTQGNWGQEYPVDVQLSQADPDQYDGLLLPGGVRNPDRMRRNPDAWRFIQAFFKAGKPVAAICHAPWLLIDSETLDGRTLTSFPSLQMDLKNAGGNWVDREVVVNRGLITSRNPQDIPAFNKTMIEEFALSKAQSWRRKAA